MAAHRVAIRRELCAWRGSYYQIIRFRPGRSTMLARAYLRASTSEQDATRARNQVEAFAAERVLRIAGLLVSGASLARPELFRLLANSGTIRCLACLEQVEPAKPGYREDRLEAAAKRTRRSPEYRSRRARPADILLDDGRNPMSSRPAHVRRRQCYDARRARCRRQKGL